MEYRDFTPLETATFDTLDKDEKEYHVIVMRGTFDITDDGLLCLAEEQKPLVATDEYHGKTNQSSIRQESDFAPYKPKTDILLDATAYAPENKPSKGFVAGVTVTQPSVPRPLPPQPSGLRHGKSDYVEWEKEIADIKANPLQAGPVICQKKLIVTGKRYWTPDLLGKWSLSDPQPINSLPVRYEYAFGGMITVYDPKEEKDRTTFYDKNPIGTGYWPDWTHKEAKRRNRVPAPQIIEFGTQPLSFGEESAPQGYGPLCRTWQPRLMLAGTYDAEWQAGRWPNLPDDFDFAYWNCAHPDLQVPFLNGNEEIQLQNLTPEGKLKVILPGHVPFVLVRYEEGEIKEAKANLDTVFIEPDAKQVSLVWRSTILSEPEVRVTEARMILRQDKETMLKEASRGR